MPTHAEPKQEEHGRRPTSRPAGSNSCASSISPFLPAGTLSPISQLRAMLNNRRTVVQLKMLQERAGHSSRVHRLLQMQRNFNLGSHTVVQRFPYLKTNDRTGRTFLITNSGSRLEATQRHGDQSDLHYGYIDY